MSWVDPDALILPPCVRKARKKDSAHHWASTDAGWRPSMRPPAKVSEQSLSQGELPEEENLWVVHERQKREDGYQKRWLAMAIGDGKILPESEDVPGDGEELAICDEDEPRQNEMLSPEESAAKSDIWHEVNKDLLEFWALTKRRKEEKHKKKQEQQRKRTLAELEHSHSQSSQMASSEKRADCVLSAPKNNTERRQAARSSTSTSTSDSAAPAAVVLLDPGDGGELAPSATTCSAAAASSGIEHEDSHTTPEYKIRVDMERRKLEASLGDLLS